jgi:hypothetical protein
MRAGLQASAKNLCGICMRMPAPSPVLISLPQAPRWSRLRQDLEAVATIWCDLRPCMSDDEADAAGIVLKPRIVEALLGRCATGRGGGEVGKVKQKKAGRDLRERPGALLVRRALSVKRSGSF